MAQDALCYRFGLAARFAVFLLQVRGQDIQERLVGDRVQFLARLAALEHGHRDPLKNLGLLRRANADIEGQLFELMLLRFSSQSSSSTSVQRS